MPCSNASSLLTLHTLARAHCYCTMGETLKGAHARCSLFVPCNQERQLHWHRLQLYCVMVYGRARQQHSLLPTSWQPIFFAHTLVCYLSNVCTPLLFSPVQLAGFGRGAGCWLPALQCTHSCKGLPGSRPSCSVLACAVSRSCCLVCLRCGYGRDGLCA